MTMNAGANPFTSPELLDDPQPFLAMGRQHMPVFFMDPPGIWHAFLYDDCRTILRDPKRFSSDFDRRLPGEAERPASMLNRDPPRHTRLRELVNKAFTPRMVAQLEPRIREITTDLLNDAAPAGRMDLIEALATPLPVIVIAEILGVPPADRAKFKRWSDEIAASLGAGLGTDQQVSTSTLDELDAYFSDIIEQRRAAPREDLISALLEADIDGEKLSMPDLLNFCVLLLVAGNETTTNLIGNGVRCLFEFPESLKRLQGDPAGWPLAVEEVLRYRSPVQATVRRVAEDLELHGQSLKADQGIVVWLASANRDPAEFPNPDSFDITRQPNRHLAFGLGIHFCLGAPLARLEAAIALFELVRRFPDLRPAPEAKYVQVPGFIMHGVQHLPIEFTPVLS